MKRSPFNNWWSPDPPKLSQAKAEWVVGGKKKGWTAHQGIWTYWCGTTGKFKFPNQKPPKRF